MVPTRLILGLVTLVLGLVFLADGANLLRADSLLDVWPVGSVAIGLIVVLQPDMANRVVGAVLLIAGVWLLLNHLGVWSYSFWRTWPYLLVVFGAWMLYRVREMRQWEAEAPRLSGFAFLDRVSRHSGARFEGGDFSAVAGHCVVDLCRVTTGGEPDTAVIDAFALFGRIELRVPEGWNVDNRVLPLLGQVQVPPPVAGGPTIVVQGSAIGGRVSVAVGP
jgi:hypothetical protein